MRKIVIDAFEVLSNVRSKKPIVHHLTNWVTIYDCANIVKVLGASPVMAHAPQEVAQMAGIASSLVLNIGTLTDDFVEAMKIAARSANAKGIPVILDVCGAGATDFRDTKSLELLNEVKIDIIKGNASEIARVAGKNVTTKGVDSSLVGDDMRFIATKLAKTRDATVVVTGEEDIVTNGMQTRIIKNGHPFMASVVGTGCMAASVIGACAAVEADLVLAASAGLVVFEVASQQAALRAAGPANFKERLFDALYSIDKKTIARLQRVFV
jgi:hydroxyethylthiazole kinase